MRAEASAPRAATSGPPRFSGAKKLLDESSIFDRIEGVSVKQDLRVKDGEIVKPSLDRAGACFAQDYPFGLSGPMVDAPIHNSGRRRRVRSWGTAASESIRGLPYH